jgi:glucosamine kinase
MAYYLAIDGGGTKTRCVLADETTVLATAMTGGSNMVRLGESRSREALHAAIRQVCATANVTPDQIHSICIGAAGAARPEIVAKIHNMLAELFSKIAPANIEVVGDSVIALESAFGTGPGVIAIAGTGSIVYGRNAAGKIARAGGWGFAVSDEGSGQWFGCRAISAILNAHDGGRETALTAMILQAWRINTIDELVQQANSTPPPDFPRLFPIVLRAAEGNDSIARDLLVEAGAKLAGLAALVLRRLTLDAQSAMLPVAMTGSVFRQSSTVREAFFKALQNILPGIELRQDLADPTNGALARARRYVETGLGPSHAV